MNTLSLLANLLEYPGPGYEEHLAAAEPAAAGFVRRMRQMAEGEREELYCATFDINPSCVPYTGVHLFGEENFKRGEYMAALFARYAESGFTGNGDLPDHIANLLRFSTTVSETESRELAGFCLLGPLEKMTASLEGGNPYRELLETVQSALHDAMPGISAEPDPQERAGSCVSAGCASCGAAAQPGPAYA